MLNFDRQKFFAGYRSEFGSLTQQQVNGLNSLLASIEADPYITHIRQASFLLGTTKHETADTFHPIHEYGSKSYFIKRYGGQTKKGKELGNDTPDEGYYYAGKGYPQTTGESNYEKAEDAIRREYPDVVADFERRTGKTFDLTVGDQPNDTADPQNMMDPAIAYVTMSYGARTGMFTGHKLSQYVSATKKDYKGSRRVINGQDKAALIAGYCEAFERILAKAKTAVPVPEEKPAVETPGLPETSAGAGPEVPGGEITTKKETATPGGSESVEVTQKNQQDVNETVQQDPHTPYNGIGLKETLKGDAKAVLPANFGMQTISELIQQATGLPPWVAGLVTKAAVLVIVASVVWVIYRFVSYFLHNWRENERIKLQALINTDINRKNLEYKR